MFTVALIGLDGVGKTTVARGLEQDFPFPIKYIYMGDNIATSNYTLPTTRWWKTRQRAGVNGNAAVGAVPKRSAAVRGRSAAPLKRVRHAARKTLGLANRVFEELYRERVLARFRKRGFIVVLDRHFVLDYYHHDHDARGRQPFKKRVEARFRRVISRLPDLVICLDAPAEVAFARKGEFTIEHLRKRRQQYLSLRSVVDRFEVVDATRDLDTVRQEVKARILRFRDQRSASRA